jgi:predicted MPP superfamily phosphohydrolase
VPGIFSLQISGHIHGRQIFPIPWLMQRVFGKFTWGPPMRVGTSSGIVLLEFEV